MTTDDSAIEQMVQKAIADDAAYQREAHPSYTTGPRVLVRDGNCVVARRPFRKDGCWCVRWSGVARLTKPIREGEDIVFNADWAREQVSA